MFPNYCFTRCGANENVYHMLKHDYSPKLTSSTRTCPHSSKSNAGPEPSRKCVLQAPKELHVQDANGKRERRVRKLRKGSNREEQTPGSVNFFLTPMDCQQLQNQVPPCAEPVPLDHMHRSKQMKPEEMPEMPAQTPKDANQELQESCADFFNIVHDNVLQAVQSSVEKMVVQYFETTMNKMQQLAAQMAKNEAMLAKMHRDLTNKMAEQNETSINQFKFVAQMLIDNQTVHYRALHSQQRQRQLSRQKRSKDYESSDMSQEQRSLAGDGEVSPSVSKVKQHKLQQQQQPTVYSSRPFQHCDSRPSRSPSKPSTIRRLPKGMGTASMPNLHRRTSGSTMQSSAAGRQKGRSPTPYGHARQANGHRLYVRTDNLALYSQQQQQQQQQRRRRGGVSRSSCSIQRKSSSRQAVGGCSADNVAKRALHSF